MKKTRSSRLSLVGGPDQPARNAFGAGFLGVSEKTLRSRHLPAMLKDGRLVRRFPDRPRRRGQAYGAPSKS